MNKRYPWDRLKKPGDSFIWRKRADERSLRSQANKQGTRRRVVYRVTVESPKSLRVTFVNAILASPARRAGSPVSGPTPPGT